MKETDNTPVQLVPVQTERQQAANRMAGHIQQASRNTGISFSYLMAQAGKESDFQSNSSSRASSAAGLYQFTKGTWMQLVKLHGASHGLGDLADKITKNSHGEYSVSDAAARQQILDLRRDPKLSAMMAGEYAKDNKAWLERTLGRPVSSTDLYMAHFLGPGGAAKVLKARDQNPQQSAAALVPQAARKNPTVFYDANHSAQSVAAVYDKINHAIERPMRQYAKMEDQPTVSASPDGASSGNALVGGVDLAAAAENSARIASSKRHSASQVAHYEQTNKTVLAALTAKGAKTADPSWPFEQSHWPPAYVPPVNPSALAAATIVDHTDQVAYTDSAASADQISAPMPPAPGLSPQDLDGLQTQKAGLGKLLTTVRKGLFG
ncbi:MAG TPA: hypothetical protein VM661_18980 [Candidatus Sulfotelmatobacter sp.]|jgi:hypothetical protein|nr:hypothetical protein [Candidatus Sulfotelmatobacter sp.]